MRTTRYAAEMMSGLQLEGVGKKGPLSITDFQAMCNAVTVEDLRAIVEELDFRECNFIKAVGMTVKPEGYVEPEEGDDVIVRGPPGGTRGGPLMG